MNATLEGGGKEGVEREGHLIYLFTKPQILPTAPFNELYATLACVYIQDSQSSSFGNVWKKAWQGIG